jgi:hypothetical protein
MSKRRRAPRVRVRRRVIFPEILEAIGPGLGASSWAGVQICRRVTAAPPVSLARRQSGVEKIAMTIYS